MAKRESLPKEPVRLFTVNIPERIMSRLAEDAKTQNRSIGAILRGILEDEYADIDVPDDYFTVDAILERRRARA